MIKRIVMFQKTLLQLSGKQLSKNGAFSKKNFIPLILLCILISFFKIPNLGIQVLAAALVCYSIYITVADIRKSYLPTPVSAKFLIFNVFLMIIVLSALAFLVIFVLGGILMLILFLIFSFLSSAGLDVTNETGQSPDLLHNNPDFIAQVWKTDLFFLFIVVLLLFVIVAISFIGNKKARLTSLIIFISSLCLFIAAIFFSIKNSGFSDSSSDSIWYYGFWQLPQADTILICLGIITIIAVPLSILITYKSYANRYRQKIS